MNHPGGDRFPPGNSNFLAQVVGGFKSNNVSNNNGSLTFSETKSPMTEKERKELIYVISISYFIINQLDK
jgi:hypothetical protein